MPLARREPVSCFLWGDSRGQSAPQLKPNPACMKRRGLRASDYSAAMSQERTGRRIRLECLSRDASVESSHCLSVSRIPLLDSLEMQTRRQRCSLCLLSCPATICPLPDCLDYQQQRQLPSTAAALHRLQAFRDLAELGSVCSRAPPARTFVR